jgi:hypothetical protein
MHIHECVGKTSYLYVLLIDRLLRGRNTIFQSTEGTVYEISNTVRELYLCCRHWQAKMY